MDTQMERKRSTLHMEELRRIVSERVAESLATLRSIQSPESVRIAERIDREYPKDS